MLAANAWAAGPVTPDWRKKLKPSEEIDHALAVLAAAACFVWKRKA
jgi:hypothetical protein